MYPALFLDRDGVIIENRSNYVRSWNDVEIFPQALEALSCIYHSPYKIVIVTNQSAVGRGLVNIQEVHHINNRLMSEIQQAGGRVDGVFICPHAPQDNCDCRKPRPGLLLAASTSLSLDLQCSIMIGDAFSDLLAGSAAGIPRLALVKTGRGLEQLELPEASSLAHYSVFDNLLTALKVLIQT
jgi:D-glycero-D-manno-heptose 1,7-bisphosphate phosphatase